MSRRGARLPHRIPPDILGQPLTPREAQVLALRARGLTSAAIGKQLGISANTVKKHMTAALLKLGLHNAGQACYVVYGCERKDCPARLQKPAGAP